MPTSLSMNMKNINIFKLSSLFKQRKFLFVNQRARNKSNFAGNTILLEYENSKYVCISALEFFEFRTSDKIIDYISLMGNNMTPYVFAVGSRYTYFISTRYKFNEKDKIEEGM